MSLNRNRWWGAVLQFLEAGISFSRVPRSTLFRSGETRQGSRYASNSFLWRPTKLFRPAMQSVLVWWTNMQVGHISPFWQLLQLNLTPNLLAMPFLATFLGIKSVVFWWLGNFRSLIFAQTDVGIRKAISVFHGGSAAHVKKEWVTDVSSWGFHGIKLIQIDPKCFAITVSRSHQ